jgi:UrcA family protein
LKHLKTYILALALAIPAVGYAADPADNATSVTVRYNDLDLDKSADAAILLQRIDDAAMAACGASSASLRDYRESVRHSACHEASMSRALAALNLPAVNRLYRTQPYTVAATD